MGSSVNDSCSLDSASLPEPPASRPIGAEWTSLTNRIRSNSRLFSLDQSLGASSLSIVSSEAGEDTAGPVRRAGSNAKVSTH